MNKFYTLFLFLVSFATSLTANPWYFFGERGSQSSKKVVPVSTEESDDTQEIIVETENEEAQNSPRVFNKKQDSLNELANQSSLHTSQKEKRNPILDDHQSTLQRSEHDDMTGKGQYDAELATLKVKRESPFKNYVRHVRTALPNLVFSAAMTGFAMNEVYNHEGLDVSIIPVSSLALLGWIHTIRTLNSGQGSALSIVPNTVKDAVRTGVSLVPGAFYWVYDHMNNVPVELSEGTKKCVRKCLERQ